MTTASTLARWSLTAAVLVPLAGCGAVRQSGGMSRTLGPAAPPPEMGASAAQTDLRTPREILQGVEPETHSQVLPGFSKEAVPTEVMLQEQVHAGYNDSPTPVN